MSVNEWSGNQTHDTTAIPYLWLAVPIAYKLYIAHFYICDLGQARGVEEFDLMMCLSDRQQMPVSVLVLDTSESSERV